VLILSTIVPSTTISHWRSADDAGDCLRRALCLSAGFPICFVECLLDIAHSPLHLAFYLRRSAFRLLGLVASQFSELLLDFPCYIFGSAFCLIAVYGVSP
jgi:hypothetical protein